MQKRKQSARKRKVGVVDFETDPFLHGRIPAPFAGCVYFSPAEYYMVWGAGCERRIAEIISELPACDIYAHNGGKFDFHFLLPYVNRDDVKIIGGRLAVLEIGKATLIDSMLLIPFALAKFKKTEIDYTLFEEDTREENRQEIIDYLLDDCRDLLELVNGFHERLGKKLTIGAAAIGQIKKAGIKIEKQGRTHDETFRPFYYGGRVEAIRPGIHTGTFTCIDLNSAYPHAMLQDHPIGNKSEYTVSKRLPKTPGACFVDVNARSVGALPYRNEKGSLSFPRDGALRRYQVTGWEIAAGLDTDTLEIESINAVWSPERTQNFRAFVLPAYAARQAAKAEGRTLDELVLKTVMNSGYGKYATNPDNFYSWTITDPGEHPGDGWELYGEGPHAWIWRTPADEQSKERGFFDVAIGASITGAVRASLWRAMCAVDDVYYCDTDSIICEDTGGLELDPDTLGAWKVEMEGNQLAIAGKKLYAFAGSGGKNKIASKGAKLTCEEIFRVAAGKLVTWKNSAPTFSVKNGANFVKREIRRIS